MKKRICLVAVAMALSASAPAGAGAPPLAGCYERVYDAAHLVQHKRQLVVRAALTVTASRHEPEWIADGSLSLWLRGRDKSFDSHGACEAAGNGLLCGGSLSAAEADACKSKQDGVRQCRIDQGNPGSFRIEGRPNGVRVSIVERLELVQAPYDGGPFLYFSPGNAENHDFLLKKVECK